jgi:hypothetical protein
MAGVPYRGAEELIEQCRFANLCRAVLLDEVHALHRDLFLVRPGAAEAADVRGFDGPGIPVNPELGHPDFA